MTFGQIAVLKKRLIHLILFLVTFFTTTMAGVEWTVGKFWLMTGVTLEDFVMGLSFSVPFLLALTCHEFGHYFTARYYQLRVSLPYYIPMWFLGLGPSIGTMGAFIRISSYLKTRTHFFDVGISGPLAGFVVAFWVIVYGFAYLPPPEHIFTIHPEYEPYGLDYALHVYENLPEGANFQMGTNLMFELFKWVFSWQGNKIPNPYEMMHYPWLLAGYLTCFFTALNLLPAGQLDGGHILYAIVGKKWHKKISLTTLLVLLTFGGVGFFSVEDDWEHLLTYSPIYLLYLYFVLERAFEYRKDALLVGVGIFLIQFTAASLFPGVEGFMGWLVFGGVIGRFLGITHPGAVSEEPLSASRKRLALFALIVFVLCFSPMPFVVK